MKKAILIIILGLLWCNVSFAEHLKIKKANENEIWLQEKFVNNHEWVMAPAHCAKYKKFAYNAWHSSPDGKWSIWYCSNKKMSFINGKEVKWTNYDPNHEWARAATKSNSIAEAKQVCKDLGFNPNSEKFADCALKVMTMNFQTQQVTNSSGGTTQKIIVKNADSGWDELIRLGDKLRAGSSSSSSSSSGTRCVSTVTSFGQLVTNCR